MCGVFDGEQRNGRSGSYREQGGDLRHCLRVGGLPREAAVTEEIS
jgi:hypothetical protein